MMGSVCPMYWMRFFSLQASPARSLCLRSLAPQAGACCFFLALARGRVFFIAVPARRFCWRRACPSCRGGHLLSRKGESKQRPSKGRVSILSPWIPSQRPKALPLETGRSSRSGGKFRTGTSLCAQLVCKKALMHTKTKKKLSADRKHSSPSQQARALLCENRQFAVSVQRRSRT